MQPGTFSFRLNIPVTFTVRQQTNQYPYRLFIMPLQSNPGDFPLLIEAKSAGDYTNPNKRRKEEAIKMLN
jgi:hypothetical protein